MRVKTREHVSFRGNYDRDMVAEVSSITKVIQHDKCWLSVDDMAFEMNPEDADKFVSEAFHNGVLDLSSYKITSIPW